MDSHTRGKALPTSIRRTPTALALVLALTACHVPARTGGSASAARLESLQRRADGSKDAAILGRAALDTWVATGDAKRASAYADRALAADAHRDDALVARMLVAREALDEAGAAAAAAALLAGAPQSPYAEFAAARLSALGQKSPAVDAIIDRALAPLAQGAMSLPGRAALRAREALLSVAEGRNDDEAAAKVRAALGMPTRWTLIGPLGAYRLRGFEAPSPLDDPKKAIAKEYPAPWSAPADPIVPRRWTAPSGTLDVSEEPWRGDVFEALTDLDVRKEGVHLVSLRGASPSVVRVDGVEVARRSPLPVRAPDRTLAAVQLPEGRHRVRVRFTRAEGSSFTLQLARADGLPAEIAISPPEAGEPPAGSGAVAVPVPTGTAEALGARLAEDPSDAGAAYVRVLALAADDPEAARAAMDGALAACNESAPVRLLRADLTASDPDLPSSVATARVARDVDAALREHPELVRAQIIRFEQERQDKRWDEAAARLERAAKGARGAWPELAAARLAQDRGDRAGARRHLDAALATDPGRCEALGLRADLARREGETETAARLMPLTAACPGTSRALASWYRERGELAKAIEVAQHAVDRAPAASNPRTTLSELRTASGDAKGAADALEPLVALWPGRVDALRRMAQLEDLAGAFKSALFLRQKALRVDGSDLSLARAVALERGGESVDWAARDGLAVIREYRKSGRKWDVPAVQVLDLGAWELQPDGSSLERIHSVVQVLAKEGIDRYGEVELPDDAQALVLRTVKADGTVLEAESIAGKRAISLPDLEPGDFAEYEYLRAVPARPAAQTGWQSGPFYFRAPDVPFFESSFEMRVPASMGLEVDAHRLAAAGAPRREGDWLVFSHAVHGADPYVREPSAPPDSEVLPWLETGSGGSREDPVRQLADWVPLRLRPSDEVRRLVRGTAALPQSERVRVLVDRVREAVRGDGSTGDFSDSPEAVFARGRGNRLVALRGLLTAAGIRSHVVLARPWSATAGPYRFPRQDYYSAALLRIEPEGAPPLWMEFSVRQAPLDRLPAALSGAEAAVVPEPGEQVQTLVLPELDPSLDRTDAAFDLELGTDGVLHGTLSQTAHGFDAAGTRRRLEQLNETELRKQQERMLGSTFRGVALERVDVDDPGSTEKPVTVRTTFRVPRFAQRPDGSLAFPANMGPQNLGPRFVTRSERRTPLMIANSYTTRASARLRLPAGTAARAPDPAAISGEFGSFHQRWTLEAGVLVMDETAVMRRGRIAPERYADFAKFAAGVDAAQQREVALVQR